MISSIKHEKHVANLARVLETHDGKKAILQTWEVWRQGKFTDVYGNTFVYKRGRRTTMEDVEYERELTRRVRNLFVRLEAMKPIGELED